MWLLKKLLFLYASLFAIVWTIGLLYKIVYNGWHPWGLIYLLPVDLFLILIFFDQRKKR